MDLAIINTWILSFKGNNLGMIKNGVVGITDNKITHIGKTEEINFKQAKKIIDGTDHITMPGLVNCHIHSGSTFLRGGAQDVPEIEWMNKAIGPFYKHVKEEDLIIGSQLGVIEGLKTGTTTFVEYGSKVAELVNKVYLPFQTRVVATETINEVSRNRSHLKPNDLYEYERNKGEKAFKRNRELISRFKNKELVECQYGPQALDMISLELLQSIKEEALEQGCFIHMHIAQGERERIQIKKRYGKDMTTVKVLKKENMLGDFLIGTHCHDTTQNERDLMAKKRVKMIGCPSSISMIDGIVPPVYDFDQRGVKVGLGTDQAPGPGTHNMFREMRTISILTKTLLQDPTVLPSWEILQLGTKKGAEVLGMSNKIGSLEVGKLADVITVNLANVNLIPKITEPLRTFVPNLAYSSTGYEVNNVIIDGKVIIENNQFTEIKELEILKEANKRARRVFRDATEDWKKADSELVKRVEEGLL